MQLAIEPVSAALSADGDGVIRVGETRVTLETVVLAFRDGATPEEIVEQYPSLTLPDAYAVIAFYLRKKPEVDAYLVEQERIADDVRVMNESRFPPLGVRDRLVARRQATG